MVRNILMFVGLIISTFYLKLFLIFYVVRGEERFRCLDYLFDLDDTKFFFSKC